MRYAAIYETPSGDQIFIKNISHLPHFGLVERIPDGSDRYAKVISVSKMSCVQTINSTFSNAVDAS